MTPAEAKHELGASVLGDITEVRSWLQEGMSKGATESWLTSRAIIGYVELVDCVRDSTSPWAEEEVREPAPRSYSSHPFTTTDHQAVFWAWNLSKQSQEDGYARIAGSMMGAQVDLNPHQADAAHRVRNSWQKKNIMGRALKAATAHARKILLTATPLQNSAMELFGLLSFIDPRSFGSEESFRAQYLSLADEGRYRDLRKRIEPFFYRTLRRQVLEYIQYTKRIALTETYTPGEEEQSFYDDFTEWLSRKDLFSVPASQRALLTLVLHKLLASSTFAVQNALDRIEQRLMDLSAEWEIGEVLDDLDGVDAESEEWDEENGDPGTEAVDQEALTRELSEIRDFKRRVRAISTNAKGDKLLTALELGFRKMQELGAADKAIIFTESKRTQKYLQEILAESVYAGSVVLFNSENKDPESRSIYKAWLAENQGSDRITGSASSDMRAALVDHFKHSAKIMIATEAAAEGVNLQFCSLVINYDLPWNPQRIEQRIGRCHRYGQKFDVVLVNFLNTKNRADERVYELLKEKLKLFDEAFGQLQLEFDETISQTMTKAHVKVLENLDEEVHLRLKMRESEARALMSSQARALYYLSKHLLGSEEDWNDEGASFSYQGQSYRFKVEVMTRASKHETEEILIVGALTDDGTVLYPDIAQKLFQLPAVSRPLRESVPEQLQAVTDIQRGRIQEEAQQRQQSYFSTEIDKLDLWAEDLKNGLELRIKELEVLIKETKKASTLAITLEDKLALQKQVKELEAERNQARKRLFDAQDEIDAKRDEIIAGIERELESSVSSERLVSFRWGLV